MPSMGVGVRVAGRRTAIPGVSRISAEDPQEMFRYRFRATARKIPYHGVRAA